MKQLVFLVIYFSTSIGMFLFSLRAPGFIYQKTLIFLIGFFFIVALRDHYKEIRNKKLGEF